MSDEQLTLSQSARSIDEIKKEQEQIFLQRLAAGQANLGECEKMMNLLLQEKHLQVSGQTGDIRSKWGVEGRTSQIYDLTDIRSGNIISPPAKKTDGIMIVFKDGSNVEYTATLSPELGKIVRPSAYKNLY